MSLFNLKSPYQPSAPQQEAIDSICQGFDEGNGQQTLLGITGSGKTFVMANVIAQQGKKSLVLAHNKTLAAQLYAEFKELFPENRVEYFVSYYDYYQPESYLPTTDTYIEKESTVNEQIEKMRLRTMGSLLSRDDVIVVASISCIYGAGNPKDFQDLSMPLHIGDEFGRSQMVEQLVEMLYERNPQSLEQGQFRVRGEVVEVFPSYDDNIIRIELFGDEVDRIQEIHPVTAEVLQELDTIRLYPAKQFVVPEEKTKAAMSLIKEELKERLPELGILEAERLKKRTKYDLEMMAEIGFCSGIENYSRHFDGRKAGQPPYVLLDYFGDDFLLLIDESHQTVPQSHGMYKGDYARKKNLVEFGFRLPCAYDNRPLKFEEFERFFKRTLFVSATPADYEIVKSQKVVELILRPTGLLDPTVEVRPIAGQIDDLIKEIEKTTKNGFRSLVTTLTKRMSEDLTNYLAKKGISVRYLHSDIDSLDRIELIRQLRAGEFDVLVGINLLREGLDIPEVSLVAIMDADKEGFLRNERSLIQTMGRAARNSEGRVILYADSITHSMEVAMTKTAKRRQVQIEHNDKMGITPKTVLKDIRESYAVSGKTGSSKIIGGLKHLPEIEREKQIIELEAEMKQAAVNLDFERAIELRDTLNKLQKMAEFEANKA